MNGLFNDYLMAQIVIQFAFYITVRELLHKPIIKQLPNAHLVFKVFSIVGFLENIFISWAISHFWTNTGAMSGNANLLASVYLGFFSTIDSAFLAVQKYFNFKRLL